jgi:hypothetical protein
LKIGVYFIFLFHYIIHEHSTCIFMHHIFIFKRLCHFQFSQKSATLRWRRKTKQTYDNSKDQNLSYNLKCKKSQKDLQLIFFWISNFFVSIYTCLKKLQAYAKKKFIYFFITKEFHYLHKAIGRGNTSP